MMGLYTTWYNNGSVEQSKDLYSFGDASCNHMKSSPKNVKEGNHYQIATVPVEQQVQFYSP